MEEHVLGLLAEMRRHRVRDGDSKYWLTLRRQVIARAVSAEKAKKWVDWLRATQPLGPWAQRTHCILCDRRLPADYESGCDLDPDEEVCGSCAEAEMQAELEAAEEAREAERLWYHDLSGEAWDDVAPEGLGAELFHSDRPDADRYEFDQ